MVTDYEDEDMRVVSCGDGFLKRIGSGVRVRARDKVDGTQRGRISNVLFL